MRDLYKAVYNEDEANNGVYGISIVESPANQYEFIALSEQIEVIKLADVLKRTLTGVVLAPNQIISRKFSNSNEYYNLKFEEETIELLSQNFLKKSYQRNTTYNHDNNKWLEGTTIVESWIVNDPANDKSNSLGLKNVTKGSWIVSMKLSKELWSEYIETGLTKGFSIDAFLKIEKIEQEKKEEKKEEKMSILKQVIKLISTSKTQQLKLASIEIEDLGILVADSFTEGQTVFIETDGEPVEAKNISFIYEGTSFKTDENGVIVSATKTPEDEQDATLESQKLCSNEQCKYLKLKLEEVTPKYDILVKENETLSDATLESQKIIDELKLKLEEVTSKYEILVKENEMLSDSPADIKLSSQKVKQSKIARETSLQAIRRILKK